MQIHAGLCQKQVITLNQRYLAWRERISAFLGVGGYFYTNSDNGTALLSGRGLLISKTTSQPPLHSIPWFLTYSHCFMTGALHITSSWADCFWVIGENCSHSNVGRVDFLLFFFFALHITTHILHCNMLHIRYITVNHNFSPHLLSSYTIQQGGWECREQTNQITLCSRRQIWPACPAAPRRFQARALLSQQKLSQDNWCLTAHKASKLISWTHSLFGHVVNSSYLLKLESEFLAPFTSCQMIMWVKGEPVLSC